MAGSLVLVDVDGARTPAVPDPVSLAPGSLLGTGRPSPSVDRTGTWRGGLRLEFGVKERFVVPALYGAAPGLTSSRLPLKVDASGLEEAKGSGVGVRSGARRLDGRHGCGRAAHARTVRAGPGRAGRSTGLPRLPRPPGPRQVGPRLKSR